jgi:RNA polymerase sigma-70 factor (ECF subfamily)
MSSDLPSPDELIPTRDSLLSRLKDRQDEDSWRDFFNTYWKLVYGVALKAGLTGEEAQDVVQETVITVARRIPEFKYDPAVCSFKTWLLNLTRWRIIDQIRKRPPHHVHSHHGRRHSNRTATVERIADPSRPDLDALWDEEWRQQLLDAAVQRVKKKVNPEHYQIFHLCVFKEWPAKKVASELGVSVARVYLSKHRVGVVLKKEVKTLEQTFNDR